MRKIGKKTVFVAGMAAVLTFAGCESKEKKAEREAAAERERIAVIEKAEREAQKRKDDLTCFIYDSLMNVPNTVDGMSAKQAYTYCNDFEYGKGMGTRRELDSLKYNCTQKDILHQRIVNSGNAIIAKHLNAMYASLNTYHLGINVESRIHEICSQDPYICNPDPYGMLASDTIYGVNRWDYDYFKDSFVENVLRGADTAKYGTARQEEIVSIVRNAFDKMNEELVQNRIAIAKEFADYYPVLDIDRVPKQYRQYFANFDPFIYTSEGDLSHNTEYLQQSFAIVKSVDVYDSQLKPEFFNIPNATYKLVNVSKGKWQVVRTLKNGKVDKTPVFTHNVDYKTFLEYWVSQENKKSGDCSFYANAGSNLGVHISVTEYEYVAQSTKSDAIPDPKGQRAERIAQLEQKSAELNALSNACWDYSARASERAAKLAAERLPYNH